MTNVGSNPMGSFSWKRSSSMEALTDPPRKHFDTSGKSAALLHHRTICKTPMALPDNGLFGAIAGKKCLPTTEDAPARHSEGSPLALPSRALPMREPEEIST